MSGTYKVSGPGCLGTLPQEPFIPRDRTSAEIASGYLLKAIEDEERMRSELQEAREELAALKAKLRELSSE